MCVCAKINSIIQIVYLFIWFAQVMVAVIYMGIALVVCASDEKPPKEATPENKETPAEKDETTTDKGDTSAEKTAYKDCLNTCERKQKGCLEQCSDWFMVACNPKCLVAGQLCKGSCVMQ